jgi:hypothetical protein
LILICVTVHVLVNMHAHAQGGVYFHIDTGTWVYVIHILHASFAGSNAFLQVLYNVLAPCSVTKLTKSRPHDELCLDAKTMRILTMN